MKKITTEVSAKKEEYGTIVATVHDKHGNIKQCVEQPVDSFNRQIWRTIQRNLSGLSTTGFVVLTNSSTNPGGSVGSFNFDGIVNSYAGIVVGTGNSVMTYDTVIMDAIVDHGTASGQFFASDVTTEFDTSTGIATFTRTFMSLNSASSTINIKEVGLAAGTAQNSPKSSSGLLVRDVLLTPLDVSFDETLTVQYKIRISSGTNNWTNATIRAFTYSNAVYTATNTTGSVINPVTTADPYNLITLEGDDSMGILFGTSNTAFAKTQINLGSKINHGNSAGQLFYHPVTNSTIIENSATNSMRFLFYRAVENRSGANISISEAGLFSKYTVSTNSRIMFDRRVVEPPVTVTNGNTVTFTWEFCYTV
jgi:hypothetical protein